MQAPHAERIRLALERKTAIKRERAISLAAAQAYRMAVLHLVPFSYMPGFEDRTVFNDPQLAALSGRNT